MTISNHITLEDLLAMSVGEIAALPAGQLALLQDDIAQVRDVVKSGKDRLDAALDRKYGARVDRLRADQGRDTGTVRFEDDGITIVADLPKKVVWDQERLVQVGMHLGAEGEDPEEYIQCTYRVPERRYAAWPRHIRDLFAPARTVKTGRPGFEFRSGEGEGA